MTDEQNRNNEEPVSQINSTGTMQGMIPPQIIHHVGVLDLRGVPAEKVARIRQISSADVVVLDEENRFAMERVTMHHVGTIIVATPDERIIVTPQLEISRSGMEGMSGGQKLLLLGNVWFRPDVPADLVAEKIESLRLAGILIACSAVHGVLLGKIQLINGVTLALPDNVGAVVRDVGETWMTYDYVSDLPDDTVYLNFGKTRISDSVDLELIRQKIRSYYNIGETFGTMKQLSLLQARCPTNVGKFKD